jgi:predicted dehydrogenase
MPAINRREFLQTSSALGAGLTAYAAAGRARGGQSPNETLAVGVMGLGRGLAHVNALLELPNVQLTHICDVDQKRIEQARKSVGTRLPEKVKDVRDFHRILDDKSVDAVFIATCNHWHAPATILACTAGKHVYVEKPGSHNPREGEMMVQAARNNDRVVQMGNQRRTWPAVIEAMAKLRDGAIGNVTFARCWYNNQRGSIGKGKQVPVPANLDYDMWQGPAPERPYKDNLIHYNWHWHWHWGNGELGNNGIHALDLVRWGLDVDYPTKVTYLGGRYCFDDDQETPDTGTTTFHFGDKGATWEQSSCHPRRPEKQPFVAFYGDQGSLEIEGMGYVIYDMEGREVAKQNGPGGERDHIANFLDCIRSGEKPNSEIEEGQKGTLMCHLGNIAYRTGRVINFDPEKRRIVGDQDAEKYWSREYRKGWEPKV